MTPHEQIFRVLGDLVDGRVFPGIAEPATQTPYLTFQIIGGPPINFVTGERPSKRFMRVQVNTWATTSVEASQVAMQAEDAIRASRALQAEVLTTAADTYDDPTEYRGAVQEFMLFC